MSDPDPFDEIVRHLDLDIPFPDHVEIPRPAASEQPPTPAQPPAPSDDQFYRRIPRRDPTPKNPRILFAWLGVIGGPAAIMMFGVLHLIMPRPVLLGVGLVFVASSIYLIAQLPERGPAEPNWPDDGAQL